MSLFVGTEAGQLHLTHFPAALFTALVNLI